MKKTLIFPTLIGLMLSLSACVNIPSNGGTATQGINSSSTSSRSQNQKIGYIHRAYDQNGKHMVDIDLTEGFFTDQDAGNAIREDNPDCAKDSLDATCQPPQGWYLRNKDTAASTLPVSDQAQILMETLDPYKQQPGTKISFEDFGKLLDNSQRNFKNIPFWVTISNGTVLEIREQFIP
ncbi:hypothetical protein FJZ27_03295 [Candidatus Peribacteria bacterium]|nr:hypothetical protein [Candidatus Peribacteria bacterium]